MSEFIAKLKLVLHYLRGGRRQVVAAIIEKEGTFLIAKRRGGTRLGGKWEFPGGKREPGETPESCLYREIKEELGIEIEVREFFLENRFSYCGVPLELLTYRCRQISGVVTLREHDDVRWVKPEDFEKFDLVGADVPVAALLARIHRGRCAGPS